MKISFVRPGVSRPWVVDDELWKLMEPLLPPWPAKAPGPRPIPDRLCLQGMLFLLHTGIGWKDLPQELEFGSGMTRWRRLQRWKRGGRVRPGSLVPARQAERGEPHRLVDGGDGR